MWMAAEERFNRDGICRRRGYCDSRRKKEKGQAQEEIALAIKARQQPISPITPEENLGDAFPPVPCGPDEVLRPIDLVNFRFPRDPGTIFGHKLIAPVVPPGASLA
jgi:hypothetical protein